MSFIAHANICLSFISSVRTSKSCQRTFACIWLPHELSEEKKLPNPPHATYCFNVTIQKRFLIAWSLESKNGSCVICHNARGSGSLRMNSHEVLLSQIYVPKSAFVCFVETFIDPALKIFVLDDKRLLITRVITWLIKNKKLLKTVFVWI